MLAQELEKHNAVLEQFMFDISPFNPDAKSLKDNKLARLLGRTFNKKKSEMTSEVLDELTPMAD
jgi:hypothetical protein